MMKLVGYELQGRLAWNDGIDGFHDVVMDQVFFRSLSAVELTHFPHDYTSEALVAQNMHGSHHILKGQCHEIFCFWFFSSISFPPAPKYAIRTVSNFFENSRRIFTAKH